MTDDDEEKPVQRTPAQARQGVVSGRVLTVLVVSLVLVALGFGLAFMLSGQ